MKLKKLEQIEDYKQVAGWRASSVQPALPEKAARPAGLSGTQQRRVAHILAGLLALAVVMLLCVSFGAVSIPLDTTFKIIWNHLLGSFWPMPVDYPPGSDTIIWQIRLPRLVLAACVGSGLAGSGAIYQGLFRNPLADPYLVGVAQGAAVGAVAAIVLPLPAFIYEAGAIQWGAFAGAILTVTLVYNLARVGGEVRTATLLLAGVAIGSLCAAVTTMLTYLHNDKLTTIYGWLLGGFNTSGGWENVGRILPYLALSAGLALLFGRALNVLQMGEDQAIHLGINVRLVKLAVVAAATLMAAAAVSVSGIIGFVGLVVPHAVRLLTGHDYRLLVPLSLVYGALFMVLTDSVARSAVAPAEIPVSIITALLGGPFFIYILRRKKKVRL